MFFIHVKDNTTFKGFMDCDGFILLRALPSQDTSRLVFGFRFKLMSPMDRRAGNFQGNEIVEILSSIDGGYSYSNMIGTIEDSSQSLSYTLTATASFRIRLKDYPSVYVDTGFYYIVSYDLTAIYLPTGSPTIEIVWKQPTAFNVIIQVATTEVVLYRVQPGTAGENRWVWTIPPINLGVTCQISVRHYDFPDIVSVITFQLFSPIEKIFTAPNSYLPLTLTFSDTFPVTIGVSESQSGIGTVLGTSSNGLFELGAQPHFMYGDVPIYHTVTLGLSGLLHVPWAIRRLTLVSQRHVLTWYQENYPDTRVNADMYCQEFFLGCYSTRPNTIEVILKNLRTGEDIHYQTSVGRQQQEGRWYHDLSFILPTDVQSGRRFTGGLQPYLFDTNNPSVHLYGRTRQVDYAILGCWGQHYDYGAYMGARLLRYKVHVRYDGNIRQDHFSLVTSFVRGGTTYGHPYTHIFMDVNYTYDASSKTFDLGQIGYGHKMYWDRSNEFMIVIPYMELRVSSNTSGYYGHIDRMREINAIVDLTLYTLPANWFSGHLNPYGREMLSYPETLRLYPGKYNQPSNATSVTSSGSSGSCIGCSSGNSWSTLFGSGSGSVSSLF